MKLEKPEDREMDLLLDEIPNAVSPNPFHDHPATTNLPTFPFNGLNGFSEGSSSSSSSLSGAFSVISDDPLRFSPDLSRRTPSSDELGLLDRFRALHVEPAIWADQPVNRRPVDNVFGILPRPSDRTVFGSGVMDSWHPLNSCSREVRLPSYGEDLIGSVPIHGTNSVFGTGVGNNGGDLVGSFSYVHPHYVNNGYNGYELNQNLGFLKQPGTGIGLMSRNLRRNDEVCYEDGFIVQGKGLRYVGSNARDVRERKRLSSHERLQCRGSSVVNVDREKVSRANSPIVSPLKYEHLQVHVEEYVYLIAKDQHGCRLLQRKFEEGKRQEIDAIFNGIVGHVVELMVNPFGNYLMQKLMEVCTEEQRMRILVVLTEDPSELVRISLDTHGTRSVQKLIETLKTMQQIALVVSALKLGFIDLIKDLNGNHVV